MTWLSNKQLFIQCIYCISKQVIKQQHINSTKEGVCVIYKQDPGQVSVQSGGKVQRHHCFTHKNPGRGNLARPSSATKTGGGTLCHVLAPDHLRTGWQRDARRGGLCGPPESPGRHGSCVGSEHAPGGPGEQSAPLRHRDQGKVLFPKRLDAPFRLPIVLRKSSRTDLVMAECMCNRLKRTQTAWKDHSFDNGRSRSTHRTDSGYRARQTVRRPII